MCCYPCLHRWSMAHAFWTFTQDEQQWRQALSPSCKTLSLSNRFFECNSFDFFSFFYPFVKNYFSYLHFNCHMYWLTLQINELSPQSKIRVQCRSVKFLHTTHAHPCPCGPCFVQWFGRVSQYFGQSVYKGRRVGLDIISITIQFICMVPTKWMPRHFTL